MTMHIPEETQRRIPAEARAVVEAITSRQSARAFLPTPVPRQTVEDILTIAGRAPSGTNIQPWKVYVVSGEVKERITKELLHAHYHHQAEHTREWNYYPVKWRSPYIDRRRKCGFGLYGVLGIKKGEEQKMEDQRGENYKFFGAPVGLFFTLDRDMEIGSWLDLGMFIQTIMIAARGYGLHTCAQAAFASFHKLVCPIVGIPPDEQLVVGMSLGYIDDKAIVNTFITEREPVSVFTKFVGL